MSVGRSRKTNIRCLYFRVIYPSKKLHERTTDISGFYRFVFSRNISLLLANLCLMSSFPVNRELSSGKIFFAERRTQRKRCLLQYTGLTLTTLPCVNKREGTRDDPFFLANVITLFQTWREEKYFLFPPSSPEWEKGGRDGGCIRTMARSKQASINPLQSSFFSFPLRPRLKKKGTESEKGVAHTSSLPYGAVQLLQFSLGKHEGLL